MEHRGRKFLVYSEIALTTETAIKNRLSGQIYEHEKDLIAVLDQNSEVLRQDFSVRLERCVQALLANESILSGGRLDTSQVGVSEALHSGLLRKLRLVLVSALEEKRRIAILVDNLDKAWDKQSDVEKLSEFLLGLLGATGRVAADFRHVGPDSLTLNISLAVFVRADIFYRVMAKAREPDKIVYTKLTWNDDEMLLRVVEERFAAALGMPPDEVWLKYFCPAVRELPTKSYFLSRMLKRPRDLVFFVKAAITTAVNRRHAVVEEKDILDAEKQYSQFAVDSILVENEVSIKELEHIIYEFVGTDPVLAEPQIHSILTNLGVNPSKVESIIEHLCDLTFFGVEVNPGEFRFADDQAENQKNTVLARRLLLSRPGPARYKMNPAFWAFLETRA